MALDLLKAAAASGVSTSLAPKEFMMVSHRRSTVLFGASSLILCALTLLNCSRTPKFKAANAPSPAAPAPTAPLDNPTPQNVNGTGSSSGGNVNPTANNTNSNAAPSIPSQLLGTWTSDCISPDTYEPGVAALAQAKDIQLLYTFNQDGSYQKTVTIYSDATCKTATRTAISDSGNIKLGPALTTLALPSGTMIEFIPNKSGVNHEFTVFAFDSSLQMNSPILTSPYTPQSGGSKTINFTQTASSSASGS